MRREQNFRFRARLAKGLRTSQNRKEWLTCFSRTNPPGLNKKASTTLLLCFSWPPNDKCKKAQLKAFPELDIPVKNYLPCGDIVHFKEIGRNTNSFQPHI